MHRIARSAAALTFAAGVLAAAGAAGAQAQALGVPAGSAVRAGAVQGCPSGAVCIYPRNAGWNGGRPSHTYYRYGYHNLRDQVGVHRVFNNQTGGATMRTCTGYNGTGCQGYLRAGTYMDKDLTPINSITLQR